MVEYNRQIGVFSLDGIHPAPAGVPVFDVKFEIDAGGILKVNLLVHPYYCSAWNNLGPEHKSSCNTLYWALILLVTGQRHGSPHQEGAEHHHHG